MQDLRSSLPCWIQIRDKISSVYKCSILGQNSKGEGQGSYYSWKVYSFQKKSSCESQIWNKSHLCKGLNSFKMCLLVKQINNSHGYNRFAALQFPKEVIVVW